MVDRYDLITPAMKYVNYVIDRDLTPEQRAKLTLCAFPIQTEYVELEGSEYLTENKLSMIYEYQGSDFRIRYPLRHGGGVWAEDVMKTFVNSLHDLGIVIGEKTEIFDYLD